ncbi:ExbD/TolR family protein [Sphingobacterium spiritivorum]|uniref:Transport energizing protein, ExbD/TolR family n=2 Tax=Sphingobacterium spiritivorum TaxID=258 RepID=D7VJ77_SPHSI|nr:biopolymer transporter ExbD [Sphingobacterium spiritivorum]EEI92718.1 transport energizing protein, ExbD/TolR family [Sphingobacterium spiritivorum ATCC 33300]EFK58930.1 transport energizing protein, ExbD/TolR family [Sphingobacterium spiritivorum ATCC 33861]QQS94222.1 biopolymer transporter ExbD [Sphingobacterium spiritivorum]QQT36792.1 biopolymer transporter ExbD [Sphingobacterium spiritivorum]WQD33548.1 biopolymer transporter ExbD [Sphingobacterium spiritivorum]
MNIRNRRNRPSAEVHTAALNDIMFFLMLFFLLASAVSNPQVVKLLLPRSSAGEQSVAKKTMTVSITSDLQYHVDKQIVPYESLEPLIQSRMASGEELTIMLYADSSVPIQNVISVMDVANRLKIKLVLATEPRKDK